MVSIALLFISAFILFYFLIYLKVKKEKEREKEEVKLFCQKIAIFAPIINLKTYCYYKTLYITPDYLVFKNLKIKHYQDINFIRQIIKTIH